MKKLGTFRSDMFKNSAVLSEHMKYGGLEWGGGMLTVPSYLTKGCDFAYKKEFPNAPKEIMHAKNASFVRFLGGINDPRIGEVSHRGGFVDVAKRDKDGNIVFDPSHISRFDEIFSLLGKNVTIVLDNIPLALSLEKQSLDCADEKTIARNAKIKKMTEEYGNIVYPQSLDEYRFIIKSLVKYLIDRYGYDNVSQWRYRLGTEARVDTDNDGFFELYKASIEEIRKLTPEAKMSYYNCAGVEFTKNQHIDPYKFVPKIKKAKLPLDYLSVSYYSIARISADNIDGSDTNQEPILGEASVSPYYRLKNSYATYFDNINKLYSKDKKVLREVHELGLLQDEYGRFTSSPDCRGASFLFQFLLNGIEFCDISKFWHWHTLDAIPTAGKEEGEFNYLLRSNGWLFNVLDAMDGKEMTLLDVKPLASRNENMLFKACMFDDEYIVVSSFNSDRNIVFDGFVSVHLPKGIALSNKMQYTVLNRETDVYSTVKKDLIKSGYILDPRKEFVKSAFKEENDDIISNVGIYNIDPIYYPVYQNQMNSGMCKQEGYAFLDEEFEKYKKITLDSLTLKPFNAIITERTDENILTFKASTPSVMVIKIS